MRLVSVLQSEIVARVKLIINHRVLYYFIQSELDMFLVLRHKCKITNWLEHKSLDTLILHFISHFIDGKPRIQKWLLCFVTS